MDEANIRDEVDGLREAAKCVCLDIDEAVAKDLAANRKVKCDESHCDWTGRQNMILCGPHPFDPDDTVYGCPKCKEINTLIYVCDEPGCWADISSGMPTPEGYRNTCHNHIPGDM